MATKKKDTTKKSSSAPKASVSSIMKDLNGALIALSSLKYAEKDKAMAHHRAVSCVSQAIANLNTI